MGIINQLKRIMAEAKEPITEIQVVAEIGQQTYQYNLKGIVIDLVDETLIMPVGDNGRVTETVLIPENSIKKITVK